MSFSSDVKAELNRAASVSECGSPDAFIRQAFLRHGSVSDPTGAYHLEFSFKNRADAGELAAAVAAYGLRSGITERKGSFIVYIKDGDAVSDLLSVMGAPASVLRFEAMRVEKTVNNDINRNVNFQSANVNKSISASVKHVEDIRLIEAEIGLSALPPPLRELARARLNAPEMSLYELGASMSKPLTKSGVNHRLRRIGKIADSLRVR